MAAQKGKEILIKIDMDGAGTFASVGGLRSKSITINKETVDVTDSDSAGQWRELLAGAGVKSITFTGSGVFKDSASEGKVKSYFFDDTMPDCQFIVPDFGTFEGAFDIPSLEYSGEYNGEAQFSMTFESASEITFTAA
jgi:TP901-1 family phage major tail protein